MTNTNIYIKIEYNSEMLGQGVFWDDLADNIEDCRNLAARLTARRAIAENIQFSWGMWTATPYLKSEEITEI